MPEDTIKDNLVTTIKECQTNGFLAEYHSHRPELPFTVEVWYKGIFQGEFHYTQEGFKKLITSFQKLYESSKNA